MEYKRVMAEKTIIVTFRLTAAEKKAAVTKGKAQGLKLAGYVAHVVRGAISQKETSK